MDKERRDFIRRDVERSKDQKLPFDIRKPKREVARDIRYVCPKCNNVMFISRFTHMIECSSCKNLITVER